MDAAAEQLLPGVMITVMEVKVTPDLGLAKVYISFLNADNKKAALATIQENASTVRHYLAQKLKDHVRKIPEVQFYLDETIDQAERIEELLRNLNKDKGKAWT